MLKTLAQPRKQHVILHVDDDPDDLLMLREAVQSIDSGLQIVQAANGEEGLEKLRKMKLSDDLPCLIVLDLNMPRMDGKQAFRLIREDEKFSSVPVVILSTSNSGIDKLFFQGKNVEYMTKPVSFPHLVNIASKLLSYCNRESSHA